MDSIILNAGLGGFTLGASKAGFKPVLAIEKLDWLGELHAKRFSVKTISKIPAVHEIPRCEAILGQIQSIPPELLEVVKITQPRTLIFEFPARTNMEQVSAGLVGFKVWHERLNWSDWIAVNKTVNYLVAVRQDIKTCFSYFPFPDPTRHPTDDDLVVIDSRGYSNHPADKVADLIGFRHGEATTMNSRRVMMASSPTVVEIICREVADWVS